jgi:transposase-like protein
MCERGQRRRSDRCPLGHSGPSLSMVASVFSIDQNGYSSLQAATAGQRTFLIFWFNLDATLAQRNAFLRKLFKQYGRPRVVITDKLGSYSAALKSLAPGIDHRRHKGLNNRSEGSHRPTRRREKIMARFKSPGQAQLFLSVHDQVQTVFRPRRHKLSAPAYRQSRSDAHSI